MITQQDFVDLKLSILKTLSPALTIEGQQGQILRDGLNKIMDKSGALEALWQKGQKPAVGVLTLLQYLPTKAPDTILVIHNMEFWERGIFNARQGLQKGLAMEKHQKYDFLPGVNTFEANLSRIEDTLFCQDLMGKLMGLLNPYSMRVDAIQERVFELWIKLMGAQGDEQRLNGRRAFADFVTQVIEKISQPFQMQVDGIELFSFKDPAHI